MVRDPVPMIVFIASTRIVIALATAVAYEQELLALPDCSGGGGFFDTLWQFFTDCSWDTIELITALALVGIPGAPDVVSFFFIFIPNIVLVVWVLMWVRGI